MVVRKSRPASSPALFGLFPADRRDRSPGVHFAVELGSPPRKKRRPSAADADAHVDEDLGVSAFGIDLPFLKH